MGRRLLIDIGGEQPLPQVTPATPQTGSWMPAVHQAPPLAPPHDVQATPAADSVLLTWEPLPKGSAAKIQVAPDVDGAPGTWTTVAVVVDATRYTLTLPQGMVHYRVLTVRHGVESAPVTPQPVQPVSIAAEQARLDQEIADRLEGDLQAILDAAADATAKANAARDAAIDTAGAALSTAIADEVQARADAIADEAQQRIDGDVANSQSIAQSLLDAQAYADAKVLSEHDERVSADAAEANSREMLAVQMRGSYTGNDLAQVTSGLLHQERQARTDGLTALSQQMTLIQAGVGEQFDHAKIWYFTDSAEGWTSADWASSWIVPTGGNGWCYSPTGLGINRAEYTQVRARIARVGNPSGWSGRVAVYVAGQSVQFVDFDEPVWADDGTGQIRADLTGVAGDVITRIAIRGTSAPTATDHHAFDWIAIGRPAPGASSAALLAEQVARAAGDQAETTAREMLSVKLTGAANPQNLTLATLASGLLYDERQARATAVATEVARREGLSVKLTGFADPTGKSLGDLSSGLLFDERQARITAVNAEAAARSQIAAQVNDSATGLAKAHSRITDEAVAQAGVNEAASQRMDATEAKLPADGAQAASSVALSQTQAQVQQQGDVIAAQTARTDVLESRLDDVDQLENGSFERGVDGWTRLSTGAVPEQVLPANTVIYEHASIPWHGTKALRFNAYATAGRAVYSRKAFWVRPGERITLRGRCRAIGSAPPAGVRVMLGLRLADAAGAHIGNHYVPAVTSTGGAWSFADGLIEGVRVIPEGAASARIIIYVDAMESGAVLVDAVEMHRETEGDRVTALALQNIYTKTQTDGVAQSAASGATTALKSQLESPGGSIKAAQDAANAANALAGGKGKVIIQSAAPAAADRLPQNLWIDTTGGANTPKRWVSGTTWAAVTDKAATDAAAAAANAMSVANTKLDASAISNYYTKTQTDGKVDSAVSTARTALQAEINGKAASSAVDAIDVRVTQAEGNIAAASERIIGVETDIAAVGAKNLWDNGDFEIDDPDGRYITSLSSGIPTSTLPAGVSWFVSATSSGVRSGKRSLRFKAVGNVAMYSTRTVKVVPGDVLRCRLHSAGFSGTPNAGATVRIGLRMMDRAGDYIGNTYPSYYTSNGSAWSFANRNGNVDFEYVVVEGVAEVRPFIYIGNLTEGDIFVDDISIEKLGAVEEAAAAVALQLRTDVDTANNKVNAVFGFAVAANGRVIGMRAANDGTTGSIDFAGDVVRFLPPDGASAGMEMAPGQAFIRKYGPGFQQIESAIPFGPDNLIEYFGPNVGVAAASKSNATSWKDAAGNMYTGGAFSSGRLRVAVTNPQISSAAQVETGPFGTNGRPKTVTASLSYSSGGTSPTDQSGVVPTASLVVERKIGAGSWTQVAAFPATGSVESHAEPGMGYLTNLSLGGSSTFTDNNTSTQNFEYRVRIVSAANWPRIYTGGGQAQALTIVSEELPT